jgi:nucleoid DNA-binding protein
MIPVKPKILFKQIAEEDDINQQLIDDVVTHYYRTIRGLLSELKYTRINIDGIGQFVVKPKAVQKLIDKYNRNLANLDGYSLTSYHNKIRLETRLEELNNISLLIQQEKDSKEQFKNTKYAKGNLEE